VTVEVEISGRIHRVELERNGSAWVAVLEGRTVDVDAVRVGAGLSLLTSLRVDRTEIEPLPGAPASHDVVFDGLSAGEWVVYVNGQVTPARVVDPRAWRRTGRRGPNASAGSRTVRSAMPGRVVKVLVKPGDRVTARQPLVVVEAMKMENELRAPGDAVVREVKVTEGAPVEAGAILMVLE
jgi:biotin carboxyl carrier protein